MVGPDSRLTMPENPACCPDAVHSMLPATTVAAPGRLVGGLDPGQQADDPPERLDRDQPRRSVRTAMRQLSTEASDFNWLVGNFAKNTPGVAHAMVVSADGLPVAASDRLDRPKADQLAAIASGLASLTQGGARCIDGGLVKQAVVEMDRGLLVVMAISEGSCLTVLAASACDVGVVAYEMTVLVDRAGDVLTPALRAELQAALPP
jgi:uncharacterized protein